MRNDELFNLLNDISEEKIKSAGEILINNKQPAGKLHTHKKQVYIGLSVAAACLCLAIGTGTAGMHDQNSKTAETDNIIMPESTEKLACTADKSQNANNVSSKQATDISSKLKTETDAIYQNNDIGDGRIEFVPTCNEPYYIDEQTTNEPYFTGEQNDYEVNKIIKPSTKQMISHFGDSTWLSADKSIANGGVDYSPSLIDAMNAYGDDVSYRVYVEVFKDGVQTAVDANLIEKEITLLQKEGYTTAIESIVASDGNWQQHLTLHATAEQLSNFPIIDSCGFFLMLYDEYFGVQTPSDSASRNFSEGLLK